MAKRPRNAVRFGCPRCQTRLFARPSQVGSKRRCPRCQYVFTVPTVEQAAALAGKQGPDAEYAVTAPTDLPVETPVQIAVVCPLCKTRMYATLAEVGQSLVCPDCETRVVVPPPPKPAVQKTEDRPVNTGEEYPLWGTGQPPREHREAYQTYIPVVCGLCHTRMLATEAQVGQTFVCPDCGTPSVVPPPPKPVLAETGPGGQDDAETTYRLSPSPGQPGPGSQAQLIHIPVICSLCHTRLHATLDQVGQQMICPDCQTSNTVPPPPKILPKIDPMEGAGADLTYSVPIRPPEFQPIFEYSWLKELEEPEADDKARPRTKRLAATPSVLALFSGMLGFLFQPGVWGRWINFTLAGIITLAFAGAAIRFAMIQTLPTLLMSLGFSMVTGLLLLLTFSVLASSLTAVVVDMAAGNEHVENWPEGWVTEWVFDSFYVFNAVAVGVAPGSVLRWLIGSPEISHGLAMQLSAFVVFPVVFLSMLERGSAMVPFSLSILRSLRSAFWAWGVFYLVSGLLLVVANSLVSGLTMLLGGLGIGLAMPLIMATLLLYFRLLGRLAWIAAQTDEEDADEGLANQGATGQDRP